MKTAILVFGIQNRLLCHYVALHPVLLLPVHPLVLHLPRSLLCVFEPARALSRKTTSTLSLKELDLRAHVLPSPCLSLIVASPFRPQSRPSPAFVLPVSMLTARRRRLTWMRKNFTSYESLSSQTHGSISLQLIFSKKYLVGAVLDFFQPALWTYSECCRGKRGSELGRQSALSGTVQLPGLYQHCS